MNMHIYYMSVYLYYTFRIIVKHDNVLSVHTIQVFYLLPTTMDWHCKNVVMFEMCLRQRERVCNQRIIAHSFQSLGRHKFSGSSLLYALPKKVAEVVAHTHTRKHAHALLSRCICILHTHIMLY